MYAKISTQKEIASHYLNRTETHNYGAPRPGTVEYIKQKIARGKLAPFAEIIEVTPEIARHLLGHNPENRKLYEGRVLEIAEDIVAGRWQVNGETIIVSKDGDLNNGQHRCNAIIFTDTAVQTLMFFGAERESRLTVDMGKPRSVGDFLGMENVANSNLAAAVAKLHLAWSRNVYGAGKTGYGTKQELREHYFKHESAIIRAISAVGHTKFSNYAGKTSLVVAYAIIYAVNGSDCDKFFQILADGEGLKRGDAIMQARSHVLEFRSQRLREWEKLELLIKYWNSWRQGKTLMRNHSLSRSWPKIEG